MIYTLCRPILPKHRINMILKTCSHTILNPSINYIYLKIIYHFVVTIKIIIDIILIKKRTVFFPIAFHTTTFHFSLICKPNNNNYYYGYNLMYVE